MPKKKKITWTIPRAREKKQTLPGALTSDSPLRVREKLVAIRAFMTTDPFNRSLRGQRKIDLEEKLTVWTDEREYKDNDVEVRDGGWNRLYLKANELSNFKRAEEE